MWARIADNSVAELTDADPAGRFDASMIWVACSNTVRQGWTYDGTTFAAPVAPALSLATQTAAALASRISAGIAITCTGTPALSSAYALDAQTMDQIGSVARDMASGLGLPGGASTFTYPDLTGAPRMFTGTQLVALYKAQRDLLFGLNTQAAIMAQGGSPAWPTASATIA